MYFFNKWKLFAKQGVKLLYIFHSARHIAFVVCAVLSVFGQWASGVVYVECVFVAFLPDVVAVGIVDPLDAVVQRVVATQILDADAQMYALVAHKLKRSPRRGEVFERVVGCV